MLCDIKSLCLICVAIAMVRAETSTDAPRASTTADAARASTTADAPRGSATSDAPRGSATSDAPHASETSDSPRASTTADGSISPTLFTKDITLECNAENMTVTIPKEMVSAGSMVGSDLQFELSNETSCEGKDSGNYIILTSSLVECGTNRDEFNDTEVYTNRVINSYSRETISRHYVVDIPLECTYNRTKRVSKSYQLTDYTVDKELKRGGVYDFDFFIYEDENFTIPHKDYPVRIGLDETFYFAASVLSVDKSIRLSMRDCKATPSTNYDDTTSHDIIKNYEIEDDVEIQCKHGDRDLVGVKMNTFRFIGEDEDEVFLHCDLLVCGADDTESECVDQCPNYPTESARRRRDVSNFAVPPLARKRLTRGPIRIQRSAGPNEWSHHFVNKESNRKDNGGGAFSPWMIVMAVMATIVMALVVSMVVMMKKLNKVVASTQRRERLKEESVPLIADEE